LLENLGLPDNWTLPEELVIKYFSNKQETSIIARSLMYGCDRKRTVNQFYNWFPDSKEKIQFYVIHGEEKDSPYGLYQRISSKEISRAKPEIRVRNQPTPIHLKTLGESLQRNKTFVLRELFTSLKIDLSKISPDSTIQTLLESPIVDSNDLIVIGFNKVLI
jgi:hypothetical protein